MDDTKLEDRLREVLRTEGDSIPLGVTADKVQLRLQLRRSERPNRRLTFGAAAALVLAVGFGSVALLSNRGTVPPVGTSPSPSASAPAAVSANPVPDYVGPVPDIAPYPDWQPIGRVNGPGGNPQTTLDGPLPSGVSQLLVSAACNGSGSLSITMTGDTQLAVDCPTSSTKPSRQLSFVGDGTQFEVHVISSGTVTFQVLVEGSDVALHIPKVVIRHGLDEATMSTGCLGSISLAWGYTASDDCATTVPETPLKTLELSKDTVPTLRIDGWTITAADARCGRIVTSSGAPSLFEPVAQCQISAAITHSIVIFSAFPAAATPWVVELQLTAKNAAGDSFTAPFYAYVHVY
jgi:hypothetical protein